MHWAPPTSGIHFVTKAFVTFVAGLGVEGERVGEGERHADGALHGGAEQAAVAGRRRPLHPHHQQRHGVRLPLAVQLHRLEFLRTRHHDHHSGGDG